MQLSLRYGKHVTDRLITLKRFKQVMVQVGRSKVSKQHAYVNYKKVKAQLNDTKLMDLRRRFLLAVKAEDVTLEWKIGNQIKAYLGEPLLINPNWQK